MSYPNILYIHSHDTGRYIQPFGHAMPTPNFQRLAEQGVLFRQAFCANPTCSPSRAALLTGQWPHSCGMLGLAHRGFRLNDYSHHLVHTLKKAGYTTALSGFQHVGRPPAADPSEIGYDEIFDTAKNQQTTTDAAIAFLNRSHDKPFFLDVGYTVTHRSFPEPGPGDDPRYCIPPAPLPDTPETRYDTAALFRQAFCANPTCSPSRAALLTGQWPHSCGMLGLAHRGFRLNDYSHHLVHTLKKAGYTTALSGFQHVGRPPAADPSEIGYDEIFDTAKNQRATSDAAIAFLNRSHDKPFFLDVGYTVTHRSFPELGPGDDPRYCIPPAPLPDTPETRYDTAAYKTCVRILDTEVGRVLNAIDRAGLSDNTLVISTTDHGIAFPMMKCNLTDHGIGVLLIMRGPGFSGGKVIDGMVSQIDLFPTLCDVIGIDHPHWLQGKSVLPLVREETDEIHDEIFAEVNYHSYYDPQRAIRTKKWKYIRHWYPTLRPGDINCDGSPSKSYFLTQGWRRQNQPHEQLYDLIFDPYETNNLASDSNHQDAIDDLRHRLQTWMETTRDPLLAGSVPAPEGARINDPAELQV